MSKRKPSNLLYPYSVRVSPVGSVYVTDTYNHRIRKLEKDGSFSVAVSSPQNNLIRFPSDIAFGNDGDVFVVDADGSRIVKRIGKSGLLNPIKEVHVNDGKDKSLAAPTQADFFNSQLYLADTMRDRILILDPQTMKGFSIPVKRPLGVAVNRKTGEIVFTLRGANRVFVWRDGDIHVLAGSIIFGFTDGTDTASFYEPFGKASDDSGNIIVADAGNHAIRSIGPDGHVVTLAGNRSKGSDDGKSATFNYPMGVACGPDSVIFVSDTYNHKVRKIWPNLDVETVG